VTQSATATATSPAPLVLSRSFAGVTLGMTEQQIVSVLGEPAVRTWVRPAGNPEWQYDSGLTLGLSVESSSPSVLFEIRVRSPSPAKTTEGFGLGDTPDDYRRAYGRLSISDENATAPDFSHYMRAKDVDGTTVLAQFSRDERSIPVDVYSFR